MKRFLALLVCCFLLAGCASSINTQTARNYANAGHSAMQAGNWFEARKYYGRAVQNSELGGVDKRTLAVLWYEYGRASGVICDWTEAERGLNEAHGIDAQIGGPTYMSLYELARMNYDRQKYADAATYFSRTKSEFDQIQADTKDPLGYAEFLGEYAAVLDETGVSGLAADYRLRAAELRKVFPGKVAHTEKTPYGTQCTNP